MENHLSILIEGKPITLQPDFSIDIDLQNPLFDSVEVSSYPVQIPLDGNRRLLQNVEAVDADKRVVSLEHTRSHIMADGVPVCSGTLVMSDEEEISDSVSLSINASEQSFADLIGDLNCQDIPVKDRIVIGEKLGNLKVTASITSQVWVILKRGDKSKDTKKVLGSLTPHVVSNQFEPQALGFSYPAECYVKSAATQIACGLQSEGESGGHYATEINYDKHVLRKPPVKTSYINVAAAYGDLDNAGRPATYCNARVCYNHYAEEDGKTSDKQEQEQKFSQPENYGPYWCLQADRPQSGICFYVLYFLDCLFAYLGVDFDKSALLAIEDFKHLCFYSSRCSYSVEVLHAHSYYTASDPEVISGEKQVGDVKEPFFSGTSADGTHLDERLFADMNEWLSSRGCGAQLSIPPLKDKTLNEITCTPYASRGVGHIDYGTPTTYVVGIDCESITVRNHITEASASANIMQMLADSGNFPKESVSSLIDSLESAFGIKFDYDYERHRVTAYLLRDLFRKAQPARDLHFDVTSMHKVSEKITGVRMCYSSEADSKEQQANIRDKVKDYDTSYDYIQYPDPTKAEMGQTATVYDRHYSDFFKSACNSDMNVYVDVRTGNAYRVKIDANYTDAQSMNAVYFEVGQWKGMEYGDCSTINEDFVHEFSIGFTPIDFNDVNYRRECDQNENYAASDDGSSWFGPGWTGVIAGNVNAKNSQALLAAFMDEDMAHEFIPFNVDALLSSAVCDVLVRSTFSLVESYDPTKTEDGNSPLQHFDWGMAVALMRGGGTDMTAQEYDYDFDGFGNSKWRTVSGQYALCSDTMDAFGNMFDYNGNAPGLGGVNGSYDGTYTKAEAAAMMARIFPKSNADLTSVNRKRPGQAAIDAGWDVPADEYVTYLSGSSELRDIDGVVKEVLYTVIADDGTIYSPQEMLDYIYTIFTDSRFRRRPIMVCDAENRRLFIDCYALGSNVTNIIDAANYHAEVLHQFGEIYYGDEASGTVSVPVPATVWVDYGSKPMESFSLKINADKSWLVPWAQQRGISLCDADILDSFGHIATKIKSRGLWQSFMVDYAYFLLHRKRFVVRGFMQVAQLVDIRNHWHDWWLIDGHRCLINKVSCSLSVSDGLGEVELEIFSI